MSAWKGGGGELFGLFGPYLHPYEKTMMEFFFAKIGTT